MNIPNVNIICSDSRLWYYDFLFETKREKIPSTTLKHIKSCQYCQEEILRLESILPNLKEVKNDITLKFDNTINTLISLHLALVDIPITCEIAKSFIPRLTDPLLQIKIPTPINVHLDKCQACTKDFNTIKNLDLDSEQLGHLGQILADASDEESNICLDAQQYFTSIVSMDFEGISSDVLKHACTCPDCRERLLQYRKIKYEELINNNLEEKTICGKISMSDIFYLCLPYGFDHIREESKKDITYIKTHILNCPACLKKMQQLLTIVNNIVKRPNSDVITKFSLGKSNNPKEKNIEDIYSEWPISVQVIYKTPSKVQDHTNQSACIAKQKPNTLTVKIRKYAKPLATAAVILLSVALLFYSSSVKAVDLSQIYEALKNVKNAYISRSVPNKSTPIQEEWISRTFNAIILKTQDQYVLWDIQSKLRKIKYSSSNSVQTTPLPPETYSKAGQSVDSVLCILPFQNIEQVPKNAKWHFVSDEKIEDRIVNTSIYDLIWIDDGNYFHKCRFFIDNSTYLVQKTKYYFKQNIQEEYALESIEEFKYINDTEVENIIKLFQTNTN